MVETITFSKNEWNENKDKILKDGTKKIDQTIGSLAEKIDDSIEGLGFDSLVGDLLDDLQYSLFFNEKTGELSFLGRLFLDSEKINEIDALTDSTSNELAAVSTAVYEAFPTYAPYKQMIATTVNLFANTQPPLPQKDRVKLLTKENNNPPALDTQVGDSRLLTAGKKTAIGQMFPRALKESQKYLKDNFDIEIPGDIKELSLEQQFMASAGYIHKFYKETGNWTEAVLKYHLGPLGKPKDDATARERIVKNQAILDAYNKSNNTNVTSNDITAEQYRQGAIAYYELA